MVKYTEGFESVHEENGIGKRNAERRILLDFCVEKELYMANTLFYREEKRESLIVQVDVKQIDFALLGKIQKICNGCESNSMGTLA